MSAQPQQGVVARLCRAEFRGAQHQLAQGIGHRLSEAHVFHAFETTGAAAVGPRESLSEIGGEATVEVTR